MNYNNYTAVIRSNHSSKILERYKGSLKHSGCISPTLTSIKRWRLGVKSKQDGTGLCEQQTG